MRVEAQDQCDYEDDLEDECIDHEDECPYDHVSFAFIGSNGRLQFPNEYEKKYCGCFGNHKGNCGSDHISSEKLKFKTWYQPAYRANYFVTTNEVESEFPDVYSGFLSGEPWHLLLPGTDV